jgi:hypothetical protein
MNTAIQTITLRLPNGVYRQLKKVLAKDNLTVKDFLCTEITRKIYDALEIRPTASPAFNIEYVLKGEALNPSLN